MNPELANVRDGSPERFVPGMMRGELIEAEHLTRYVWAAQLARGRRVLDAGCGVGYGCAVLAQAGARDVVGVDIAAAVIEAAGQAMPESVHLEVGDLRGLSSPGEAFDLVVCFEVIEHLPEPEAALDELTRVLAPGGLLLVSSPNAHAILGHNPHHIRELTRGELATALNDRFEHVRLFRQDAHVSSAIIPEDGFGTDSVLETAIVRQIAPITPGLPSYVVAVASARPIGDVSAAVGITDRMVFEIWQKVLDAAADQAELDKQQIHELQEQARDRAELQERLLDAEQRLVSVPELELRIRELDQASERHAGEMDMLEERIARADRVLRDVQSSPSWRITKPLRSLKDALRS